MGEDRGVGEGMGVLVGGTWVVVGIRIFTVDRVGNEVVGEGWVGTILVVVQAESTTAVMIRSWHGFIGMAGFVIRGLPIES